MYKSKLVCLLIILFSTTVKAQIQRCGFEQNLAKIRISSPGSYARIMALENHTQNYINLVSQNKLSNPNATIIIPVVVHVLDNGNPIGTGPNLSVAQIQSQIDVLNEDFRKLNADRINTPSVFQSVATDANFEFRLACIDPNGNPTNGITRTLTNISTFYPLHHYNPLTQTYDEFAIGIKYTSQGDKDAWPTGKYLNIWTCSMEPFGLLGYTQKAADYAVKPSTDGIVIQFYAFGRTGNVTNPFYNLGRTATHEVGHWLNLLHLWGDAVCGNDLVADTPQQEKFNDACPSFPHFSNCTNNGSNGDMFMNYMDYSYDNCMNLFTEGQKLRMRAVFATGGPRASFINNYFKINTFNVGNGFCTGNVINITATNLICEPVTWVVSGPATITGGQGTNQVSVQATGNGLVTITGTAGGYTDSKTFTAGTLTDPVQILGIPDNYLACNNSSFNVTTDRAGNFTWDVLGGQIISGQGSTEIFIRLDNYPGGFYIGVAQSNACGLSSVLGTKQGTILDCGGGGGSDNTLVGISPNPSKGYFTVSLKSNDKKAAIKEIIIINKTGIRIYQQKFTNNQPTQNISLYGKPTDIYTVQVFDGKKWQTQKLSLLQ